VSGEDAGKREAIDAAFRKAQNDGMMWTAPSFEALLTLMQKVGIEPSNVTRARLTEIWVGRIGPCRGWAGSPPSRRHMARRNRPEWRTSRRLRAAHSR